MRRLVLIFLILPLFAHAQSDPREQEIMEIVKKQDTLPRSIFLDSTLLPGMTAWKSNTRQVWSNKSNPGKHLQQLYDIRIKFNSNAEAMAFYKEYRNENSEFGPQVKKHKMKSKDAQVFEVFKGAKLVNAMVEPMGFQMFCYIFVVDKYFGKIYVSCDKNYEPKEFQSLITEAIKRIHKEAKW